MEKITDRDIHIEKHSVDGFTLSYMTDSNLYYCKRYIGYGIREAKRRFKDYVYAEDAKVVRHMTVDDVLVMAVRGLCKGSISAARELVGVPNEKI
jgi:hypothetical protein